MKIPKMIRFLLPVFCLFLLLGSTGCASGGGNRGSLSSTGGNDSGKEGEGRGTGRTRTKNDTQTSDAGVRTSSSTDDDDYEYYDPYYEEEPDGLTVFLAGLIGSLFSGGDDDEKEVQPTSRYLNAPVEEEYDTNYREFGLPEKDEEDGDQEDDGGGLDVTRGNLNFWFSRAQLSGDAIKSFTTYTLMYSGYTGPRYRAHAGLYYGQGKRGSQQWVQDEIRWISEAGIDLGSRGYITPEHSLLGFYVLVGLRAGALYWSYTDALIASGDEGNPESISHDGVLIFTPYLGFGTSLLQTKSVHLGLNFTVGGRMALGRTFKQYDNDVFRNVGEYKLNIEASIFF